MKCYYRERPDITQHVPVERPTSPSTAQSLSYNVRQHETQVSMHTFKVMGSVDYPGGFTRVDPDWGYTED